MIKLTKFALKNPLIILSLIILIIIFGIFSIFKMQRHFIPAPAFPVINIAVEYPGADVSMVNQNIAQPIINSMRSVPALKQAYSRVYAGMFEVELLFPIVTSDYQMSQKMSEIEAKVNQIAANFPKEVKKPIITRLSANNTPITWILFRQPNNNLIEMTDSLNELKNKLLTLPGVSGVNTYGEVKTNIRINLNQEAMSYYGITLDMIYQVLSQKFTQIPGGMVVNGQNQYALLLNTEFKNINELNNIIIAYRQGAPIFLSKLATFEIENKPEDEATFWHAQPAIAFNILGDGQYDTISTLNKIQQFLTIQKESTLKNIQYKIFFSEKELIGSCLNSLLLALFLSLICTAFIVFLYLGKISVSLIVLMVIPVSMFATIITMYALGMNFNVATLLSLILLVGLVVDDAIVFVENFYRIKLEQPQKSLEEIILFSVKTILSSVIGYAIALVLIFFSVFFMTGIAKIFFENIAMVVIPGIIFSFFVSITVTPLLCLRVNKSINDNVYPLLNKVQSYIELSEKKYAKIVHYTINNKKYFLFALLGFFLPALWVFPHLGANFFPALNGGRITGEYQFDPRSSPDLITKKIENFFGKMQSQINIDDMFVIENAFLPSKGNFYIEMPVTSHFKTQKKIKELQNKFLNIAGEKIFFYAPSLIVGTPAQTFEFSLVGNNFNDLIQASEKINGLLSQYPQLGKMNIDTVKPQPAFHLKINENLLAHFGLSPEEIKQQVSLYGGQISVGQVFFNNKNYNLKIFPQKNDLSTPFDLNKIYAFNAGGKFIKLNNIANFEIINEPLIMNGLLEGYSITFSSDPLVSESSAMKTVKNIVSNTSLPKSVNFKFIGLSNYLSSMLISVGTAMAISTLLLYFLLVFQFNSFILPLILLIAQPLGVLGAVYVIYISGLTLNIYSIIGLFLLIGIVTKNSILLITLINQFRAEGKAIKEAVELACLRRVRPILMTSMTIILAMLPVLFLKDLNHKAELALGVTVIAGVCFSTLLTLIFLPVLYLSCQRQKGK